MAKQWQIAPAMPDGFLNGAYQPIVAQLLYNRGLREEQAAKHFLHPELQLVNYDPFLFRNMEAAIVLTISHIKAGSKIAVCGDYDADGVTSSGLLEEVLKTLKGNVEVWIPSRFGEGYGLNKKIIEELKERDIKLIITVDNGIRAKVEVEYAQSLGIDVIVTDHHEGPQTEAEMPPCIIIDPILERETYPFKYLCGAGVAFKFATALLSRSTLPQEDKERLEEKLVDLAAIGTISDCVTLFGENRLLAIRGLKVINKKPRLGLRELMSAAKITEGSVSGWNISWQITPRLNVAGRLDHANTAYRLLVTPDSAEARKLAEELNEKNIERQRITEEIVNAGALVAEREQADEKLLIVVSPELRGQEGTWSEGVIGLVAGRIAERFSKPCFVITQSEGMIKGSGRSVEQFDIGASLEAGKDHLLRYGGHKMACGFTVKSRQDLDSFIAAMRVTANQQLAGIELTPILKIDAELDLSAVQESLLEALEHFEPYGQDNPEPKFVSFKAVIQDIMTMGQDKKHIKFRIGGMWALGFSKAEAWKDFQIGDLIDVVYTVCFNIFNGRKEVQLKIVDLRPAQTHE